MPIEKAYFWPRWFADSLNATERQKVSNETIDKLCRANLFLWRALNIYDDFLDGEGAARNLPTANGYYRRFLEAYYRLHLSSEFYRLFQLTLEDLDKANREEAIANDIATDNERSWHSHRLPRFDGLSSLSRKSLPLGLGAAAIMDIIDCRKSRMKMAGALEIFRYALAAKQLSDDSCDWLEDLEAGRITPANAWVLEAAERKAPRTDIGSYRETLYTSFIDTTAPKICAALRHLCSKARMSAAVIGLSADSPLLSGLIAPMEAAVSRAETARAQFS